MCVFKYIIIIVAIIITARLMSGYKSEFKLIQLAKIASYTKYYTLLFSTALGRDLLYHWPFNLALSAP